MNSDDTPDDRSERLIELFEQAIQLPPAERKAFLDEACRDDAEMRAELESLLDHANNDDGALPTSAIKLAARQLADASRRDWAGEQVGHYQILRLLGEGGMGEVWLAEDSKLNRQVAIKFLTAHLGSSPALLQRFEREARAASMLNHPNIITVHEIGQHKETVYIAYELVEGQTLRQRLQDSKPSWQEAVAIGAEIAAALKAAHGTGIIHRDIKPENVMLRADGLVKVLDFGIAKRFDLPAAETNGGNLTSQSNATLAGLVLGTPGYLSPEQARGETEIDARTDIFSLGVLMYEMLAGHPYAKLSLQEKLEAVRSSDELPPLNAQRKDLPAALDAVVKKATRKSRDERFASAGEMLEALNELRTPTQANLQERDRALAQKRANQLLNQAVALYATDKNIRLSPAALWRIWRHSTIKRGRLESALLRRSYLSALGKVMAVALLAGLVTLFFAALYSVEEKWEVKVLQDGHADMIRDIALSPDGKMLVSGGNDKAAIVWDVTRRERLATLKFDQAKYVGAVAYSPDGKWFATSSTDSKVTIWDAAQFSKIKELPGEEGGINGVLAFTPNGRLLVAQEQTVKNTQQRMLNLWEVETWRLAGQSPPLGNLLASPDSRFLLGYFWHTFDLATMKHSTQHRPEESFGRGALSPDGQWMATTDKGGFVSFWDLRRFWTVGEHKLIARYAAHRDRGRAIAYSPNGRLVASGSDNIIVWDAQTQAKLARFPYRDLVTDLAFSTDSRQLISAHGDGAILVWDIAEKEATANFASHSGVVRTVVFSSDGKTVASASEDRSIILWDANSGIKRGVLSGQGVPIAGAAISADGKFVISSDIQGQVTLWDAATHRLVRNFTPPHKTDASLNYSIAISPDQKWVATTFGLYAVEDGQLVVDFLPLRGDQMPEIRGAAFSLDSHWLVCVATDGRIYRWEVGSWKFHEIKRQGNITAVTFAPDNQRLVTGENSGVIRLWQVEPLQELAVIGQHAANVESLSFSPDGRLLASASADETVKLWDVARRRFITNIGTHKPSVLSVSFSPDGKQVATGEHDQSVRIYTHEYSLWGRKLDESNWLLKLFR
ncbi:MAG: serine/threonine protein kinase [Acidobacteria bacterium]|nr:serine/threonine protein kinase [Acidobacteriota bacterium]